MSPSINDPTTAVQAIDQLHELLRMLVGRELKSSTCRDRHGVARLIVRRPTWEAFVHLGFDEIRRYGERSLQVVRRLRAALNDLLSVAPPSRRPALEEQLALIDEVSARNFPTRTDVRLAHGADAQGQGGTSMVMPTVARVPVVR